MRIFWMLIAGLAAGALPSLAAERAADGRVLALDACAACHQVGPGDPMPPLVRNGEEQRGVRAPPFADIARDPRKDGVYLRGVVRHPHYPMKEQAIEADDLDAVVAYIESLRPPHGTR